MSRGPVELVVIDFPGDVPGQQLVPEMARLIEGGLVKVVDVAFVTRSPDGQVKRYELGDRAGEPGYEALDGVVETVDGLIAATDLDAIAEGVETGHTAAVLLFENAWASRFSEIVQGAGGQLM